MYEIDHVKYHVKEKYSMHDMHTSAHTRLRLLEVMMILLSNIMLSAEGEREGTQQETERNKTQHNPVCTSLYVHRIACL